MKPCPECRIYNTNEAKVCHRCGTPFQQAQDILPIMIKAATAVLVAIILGMGFYSGNKISKKKVQSTREPASLELLSSEGYPTVSGKMLVEGIVKNISGKDLKKVYVMVSWFDKQGNKVESNNVPISITPFLNQDDTPFRIVMSENADMESYEISFFDASGNILRVIDNR